METKTKKLHITSLNELIERDLGALGSPLRDQFEFDLKLELLGTMIKQVRKERGLTQSQLGELIGVNKSQISKLEHNTKNVTVETLLRVFGALRANVKFSIQLLAWLAPRVHLPLIGPFFRQTVNSPRLSVILNFFKA